MTRKLLAELLGTFTLVFTGCGAIVVNELYGGAVTHVGICALFGLVVLSVVYAFGDVSGAHINPAVTVAFWASGRFPAKEVLPYVTMQVVGSVAASALLCLLFPDSEFLGATRVSGSLWQSFLLELVITYLLMLIIIMVATGSKEVGTLAGIAIGSAVAVLALLAGPVSGASMNPARSLGPALVSGHLNDVWVYLLAPTLGALLAVPTSNLLKGPTT
jgi:aquaporin Z